MSAPSRPGTAPLPALPHWEETPADLPAAIRQIKAALRARIAASGRTVDEAFAVVEQQIKTEVSESLATGSSPGDFPAEHYERTWVNRFRLGDFNGTGRRGLGLG